MGEHFNKLTPAEDERLAKLAEEASEVIKAVTKILRHGYESYDPTNRLHPGNRLDLQNEIQDFLNIVALMDHHEDIIMGFEDEPTINYMHHQEDMPKLKYVGLEYRTDVRETNE